MITESWPLSEIQEVSTLDTDKLSFQNSTLLCFLFLPEADVCCITNMCYDDALKWEFVYLLTVKCHRH